MSNSDIEVLKMQVNNLRKELSEKESKLTKAIRDEEIANDLRYYVYFCVVDGRMKYVGKGTGDRWKHTISGSSSCRELNRDWFEGKSFSIFRTANNLTEDEAYSQEEEFIYSFGVCDTLYNRVLPSEETRFSDWATVVQDGDKEHYGSSDLAIMHRCFHFLGSARCR